MINNNYSYIINNNSSADEILRTAIGKSSDGSLVMLIIDGRDIKIKNLDFGENIAIVISELSDSIIFDNCYFKSTVTAVENNGTRVLFSGCTFEYTRIALKSSGYEVFSGCTFKSAGKETSILSAFRNENNAYRLNYTVIMDSDIYIENNEANAFITEGDASVSAVNVGIYKGNAYVAWTKDMVNENTFSYYNCPGISGIDECGYEICKDNLNIYSLSNLLSGDNSRETFFAAVESFNNKFVFYIDVNKNIQITGGSRNAFIILHYYPSNIKPSCAFNASKGLNVRENSCGEGSIVFEITGENDSEEPEYGYVSFETGEGVKADCVVEVKPSLIEPPRFTATPEIVIKDGKAVVSYELDLKGREDLSEISWYRVDNIDRTKLVALREFVRSNEKDCRKIAVSRSKPCREIRLTPFDVGRHIKVNIKPRHIRSEAGAGLNIMSRIIMQSDIKSESIIINMENQVLNPYYKTESGYGTATGIWLYKKLPMCRYYDMVTEANDCGYYFGSDISKENMTVYIILDFENNSGEGFGNKGEYQEIYIKYDVNTKTGYGIRLECTDTANHMASIALYKYDGMMAQSISETLTGSFLKSGMDIRLDIYKNSFTTQITAPDIDKPLKLASKITGNLYSGMGIKHHAISVEKNRIGVRHIEMSFPE